MCLVVCVFHLKDAGSSGDALQYAGLIAILKEDGSVVIYILHLNKYSGCACPPAACWTVVYMKQTHSQICWLQSFRFMLILGTKGQMKETWLYQIIQSVIQSVNTKVRNPSLRHVHKMELFMY